MRVPCTISDQDPQFKYRAGVGGSLKHQKPKKGLKKEWNTWHKNTNATVLKMWLGIVKTTRCLVFTYVCTPGPLLPLCTLKVRFIRKAPQK